MLISEPIVISWALYHSFLFGVLFALFESYPYVFTRVYGFSPGEVGLAFLGIFIGTLLAVVTFGIIDKTLYQKKKALFAPAKPPPEERLYVSMLGSFGVPVALFWFAWTARPDVHFLAPIAAGIPFGWGMVALFLGGITFLLDTYGARYSASAIAANGLLRSPSGAFGSYCRNRVVEPGSASHCTAVRRRRVGISSQPCNRSRGLFTLPSFKSRVVKRAVAPVWMQHPYIERAYRQQQNSFYGCYESLWYLHNESVNIWSHLIAGVLFLAMAIWTALPAHYGGYALKRADLLAFQEYLVGVAGCCLFSAFYHCVSCHSQSIVQRCVKLDYLGIAWNITSTGISATHFGLHGNPRLANYYITMILLCGLAVFGCMVGPDVDGPRAAKFRTAVFIALGAIGFVPIFHAALSPKLTLEGFSLEHVAAQSILYLLGAAFYVNRVPEKYCRGTFDVWHGSSRASTRPKEVPNAALRTSLRTVSASGLDRRVTQVGDSDPRHGITLEDTQ
ncbi:hypothetical protein O1611_g6186 [Lasiodiplodia mahajangana]|uniref:Uncharacterized protein n=1 Tax=Lasiodiplodia mahajangana TaxID=1108764 RepID=A0ACC2JJI4_9PEZI|nr:hypothetical protein O1611_g6186 [Lasiodiplodia mahajangana]